MTTKTQTRPGKSIVNRTPFFYGWVVWAVATLGLIATSPGQSFTVSLFIDHYIADFGIDRTTVSTLYGAGTFIAALSLTWVGRQIDRRGNRRMGVIVSLLFALALVGMALVAGPLTLFLGFIAIRGLGQGSLSLTNSTVIAQWFRGRRGFVMSLSLLIWALVRSAYLPVIQNLIDTYEWRQAWVIMAIAVAVTIPALTWFFIRDRPEDHGLQPDGKPLEESDEAAVLAALDDDGWTLGEAMRTSIFWVFIFGRLLSPAWGTGLTLHQISVFAELGHGPEVVAATFGAVSLVTAGASLGFGLLIDRLRPQLIMAFQLTTMIITLYFAMIMTETWMLLVYSVAYGITMGSGGVFDGAVWANIFGRRHLGTIRGFIATTGVAGTALGPVLYGISYDKLGGYVPVLWMGIGYGIIAIIAALLVRQPTKRIRQV
ncbi:MFS transporter [Chloroflexota bacterium]